MNSWTEVAITNNVMMYVKSSQRLEAFFWARQRSTTLMKRVPVFWSFSITLVCSGWAQQHQHQLGALSMQSVGLPGLSESENWEWRRKPVILRELCRRFWYTSSLSCHMLSYHIHTGLWWTFINSYKMTPGTWKSSCTQVGVNCSINTMFWS